MNHLEQLASTHHLRLLATLYTPKAKAQVNVELNQIRGSISFRNPANSETLTVGENCSLNFMKRGWVFSEFEVSNPERSFRFKLVLFKGDGDTLQQCLDAWRQMEGTVQGDKHTPGAGSSSK